MIRVKVGTGVTERKTVIVDENRTLRSVLDENGILYDTGIVSLNGASVQGADLDKTFKDYNIVDSCFLINIIKTSNA